MYSLTDEQYDLLKDQDPVTGFYGYADHVEKCDPQEEPRPPWNGDGDCPVFGFLDKA